MYDLAEGDKKLRRLERNRESARESRKRKKDHTESLRAQLAHLEAENLQLRLKLKVGANITTQDENSKAIKGRIDTMLREGSSDVDIKTAIVELQEKYSDYGRDRRSAIDFHILQLRRCLLPTQTTRTILWLITCAPLFHDLHGMDKINPDTTDKEFIELWQSLMDSVKPDADQKRKLVEFCSAEKSPYPLLQKLTDDANTLLDRLDVLVSNKNDSLDLHMTQIQGILTARQIAKFIVWIDSNPVCMQMLETIWPHIYLINSEGKARMRSRDENHENNI
jgi:hypothetical protein